MQVTIASVTATPERPRDIVYDTHPFDIVGIGASTLDRFVMVKAFPTGREVQEAVMTAVDGGGPVATALATAGKYGIDTVMIDVIGDDIGGTHILDDFDYYNVETSHIESARDSKSASATILVNEKTGDRAIFFERSTAPELESLDKHKACIEGGHILHINGRHRKCLIEAMTICKQSGNLVSFDGGANRYDEGLKDITRASDIVIVARDYAEKYTGTMDLEEACRIIHERGAYIAGVTDGAEGSCFVWPDGTFYRCPAFPQDTVLDTTGAGDSFHGAFLTVIAKTIRNMRVECEGRRSAREVLLDCSNTIFESAADFASAVASLNTQRLGGRSGLPSLEDAVVLANSR